MNCFKLLFIMALLPIKLNAFEAPDTKELEALVNRVNEAKKDPNNFAYRFEREEILKDNNSCSHCPKHLLLTEQINKVVEKIAKDPALKISDELPVKINKLKFLYYTAALMDQNGKHDCNRYMDLTPDLKPTKFDGQFKLIAEDVLPFRAVTEIQYMNPGIDEVIYYYRGEGADKDIVVQAILTKEGGKFRYYRYTPTVAETNPYNLPELGRSIGPAPVDEGISPYSLIDNTSTKSTLGSTKLESGGASIKFKAEVEKRNKYIPKNVHFVEAVIDQDLGGGFQVKASSDTSLTGNSAKFALKSEGGHELMAIDLDTKLNGKSEHRITIPYSVRVLEEAQVSVKGRLEHSTNAQILTMSISDQSMEYIRSEFRHNTANNTTSYVLAKDIPLSPREIVSVQYAKGEDDKRYASLKHVKSTKNNITMVLDVRVDEDKKASIFYTLNAKF